MAVTVAQLKELRAAGVKRVVFSAGSEIGEVEFFDVQPAQPDASEIKDPTPEPEIPPDYAAAFSTLQKRPGKKEAPA